MTFALSSIFRKETSSLHWLTSSFSVRFGISLNICRRHETPLVSMLLLASGMVKIPTQVFLCYQSFDTLGARNFSCAVSGFGQVSQRSMNFLKIQVILDKSKPTRVAMIWLRVKVNRTRLCTAVHLARNK